MSGPGRSTNLLVLAIAVVAAAAGVILSQQRQSSLETVADHPPPAAPAAQVLAPGDPMPAFALADLDGVTRDAGAWTGRVTVVNFWATWCPPCLDEIPVFVRYQASHGDRGLQFVGIAIDDPDRVRELAAHLEINYPVLLGGDQGAALSARFGNRLGALPFSVIFDRNGRARQLLPGALDAAQVESLILPLL